MNFVNQLRAIENRLLADTNVFVKKYYAHGLKPKEERIENRVEGCCKPLLVFDGEPFYKEIKVNSTKLIIGFLNDDKIKEIKIIRKASAAALYGLSGQSGVIIFTFKDKESLTVMKKILNQLE